MELKNVITIGKYGVEIKDLNGTRNMMDSLIYEAVFAEDDRKNALLVLVNHRTPQRREGRAPRRLMSPAYGLSPCSEARSS
jgi:hypothetical protein